MMMSSTFIAQSLLLLTATFFSSSTIVVDAQSYCRSARLVNHQNGLWSDGFPLAASSQGKKALCDGTVTETATEICVDGRVTYRQLREAIGRPSRRPASDTVSLNGHLLTGSGNVVLGAEANYLYDYVTSYTVNGTVYQADDNSTNMVDNLFVASRGTIDAVCLDKDRFAPPEVRYYSTSHGVYWKGLFGGVNMDKVATANALFVSSKLIVTESYEEKDSAPFLGGIGGLLNGAVSFFGGLAPSFVLRILPLLGFLGFFRLFVFGTTSTERFPHPVPAPDPRVENTQVDTAWDTLIAAMRDGLFVTAGVPLYFNIYIKRISVGDGKACWNTDAAAIDVQAPEGFAGRIDDFVEDIYTALQVHGPVSMHMGKRFAPGGSNLLEAALNHYESECGVELDVVPENCLHPACTRRNEIVEFNYPDAYYE